MVGMCIMERLLLFFSGNFVLCIWCVLCFFYGIRDVCYVVFWVIFDVNKIIFKLKDLFENE